MSELISNIPIFIEAKVDDAHKSHVLINPNQINNIQEVKGFPYIYVYMNNDSKPLRVLESYTSFKKKLSGCAKVL